MLLLFPLRIAERPPVWEIAVHSVGVFRGRLTIRVCASFPFGFEIVCGT